MAFKLEDVIPKGYVKTETKIGDVTVITYRNPNPDPEEQRKGLEEFAQCLMPGYVRGLMKTERT